MMKTINVISPIYLNKQVNFEGFVINFNGEGKAKVEIDETKVSAFQNVLSSYPNIYDADNLPADYGKKATKEENITNTPSSVETTLKNSNIALAKENKELKKEIETLKANVAALEKQIAEVSNTSSKENIEESLEVTLNKKTLAELKAILADVYKDFQEEWKTLTKKEDIINYMISKG